LRPVRDWTGDWFGRNSLRSPRGSPFFQARGLEPTCSASLISNALLVVHGIGAVCVGGMDKPLSTRPELSHVQAGAPVKLRPPRRNQIVIERNQGPRCGNIPRILLTGRSRCARPSIQSRPRPSRSFSGTRNDPVIFLQNEDGFPKKVSFGFPRYAARS